MPACTIDMLTLTATDKQTLLIIMACFFSLTDFKVNSSSCCVIIFQLEDVLQYTDVYAGWVRGCIDRWARVCGLMTRARLPRGRSIRILGSHDVANAQPLAPSSPPLQSISQPQLFCVFPQPLAPPVNTTLARPLSLESCLWEVGGLLERAEDVL